MMKFRVQFTGDSDAGALLSYGITLIPTDEEGVQKVAEVFSKHFREIIGELSEFLPPDEDESEE